MPHFSATLLIYIAFWNGSCCSRCVQSISSKPFWVNLFSCFQTTLTIIQVNISIVNAFFITIREISPKFSLLFIVDNVKMRLFVHFHNANFAILRLYFRLHQACQVLACVLFPRFVHSAIVQCFYDVPKAVF